MGGKSRDEQTHGRVKEVPMTDELAELVDQAKAAFREKFGRDAGPGDPLFFDPEADEPQSLSAEKMDEMWRSVCDQAASDGIPPEFVYAMRKTGRVVTEENLEFLDPDELAEWEDAIDEYERRN